MRVIVHNQSVIPFPSEEGFDISTGFQTNVHISRTFQNHLPEPYSECLESTLDGDVDNPSLQLLYENFGLNEYNQKFCLKVCYQSYIIGKIKKSCV